jgi:cytidyltransferase-like protein
MKMKPKQVMAMGGFDDIRSGDLRFLEEAAKLGALNVVLWPDETLERLTGKPPKFPLSERLYFLNAVRYVTRVVPGADTAHSETLPAGMSIQIWADVRSSATPDREKFCRERNITYRVFTSDELKGFPEAQYNEPDSGSKKVIVTGSFDWLHSGHVRFLEEVSHHGDLYVIVGHDANIRLLKGGGHPLLSQEERRYMVASIKYVKQALISTGQGWLDAEPEIQKLHPDIYAVNDDGDKGGKREYCEAHGIKYLVLQRKPADGLPRRTSTDLRGF